VVADGAIILDPHLALPVCDVPGTATAASTALAAEIRVAIANEVCFILD
jgi:hypothetical protein